MTIEVRKPAPAELEKLGALRWEVWECEPSTFDWHYDEREVCYFLAGEVKVAAGDDVVTFGKGDLVVFPKGLDCTWHVLERVRKHYRFG